MAQRLVRPGLRRRPCLHGSSLTKAIGRSLDLRCRYPDRKARTGWCVVAVLHVDFPVMAFHNGPGNCEAQAGVSTKMLFLGPYRVEPVENGLPRVFRNARTLV